MRLTSGRLGVASAVLAVCTAWGQSDPTPLPPVQVPLAPLEGLLSREPSSAVTVVDLSASTDASRDAADALRTVPGAVIREAGGAGQRQTLSLRGASPNAVLVLLDGVPLAAPSEATDLSRIPTAALARIEVLRGAGSRYGPGAMGGVVNLVTRGVEGTRAFGEVSMGSFLTGRALAGASFHLGPGEGLVMAHGLTTDGAFDYTYHPQPILDLGAVTMARENNAALQGGAMARFRAQVQGTTLDVLAEGLVERRGLAGPVQNPTPLASQRSGRGLLSVHGTTALEAGGTLTTMAWGRLDDAELLGTPLGGGQARQLQRAVGGEVVVTRQLGRHGLTALVTGGGDWLSGTASQGVGWGRAGVMLGDEVSLLGGALSLDAATRLDVAGPFVVVSPKLGGTARLPLGFELRLSAGLASRPPSFSELYVVQGSLLPNAGLRPERGLGLDASLAWKGGATAVSVAGFGALYQDLISYEYYPPSLARPFNFQAARVAGLEVEAQVMPASWLELAAAYTFTASANLTDDARYALQRLPNRPQHQLHARASAGTALLRGIAELAFQSDQTTNRTGTVSLPARALVNAGVSCAPFPDGALTVSFDLKNLLDARSQDVDGYPLPPRAAYLTLGLAWDGAHR
jgi:iron complex outermembrane receptor protein